MENYTKIRRYVTVWKDNTSSKKHNRLQTQEKIAASLHNHQPKIDFRKPDDTQRQMGIVGKEQASLKASKGWGRPGVGTEVC